MTTLFIDSGTSFSGSTGVWRVSSLDYQSIYNAFTPGEDINLDQVLVRTNTYSGTQSNPGNFQVGVYSAGIDASTPGSLISFLSGPTEPTAGEYSSYTPTTSISLQAGTQYWLGFTLSSDTGGTNTQRVKVMTGTSGSTYVASGWSVGIRNVMGTGLNTGISTNPVSFQLYGTARAVCFCSGTEIRTALGEVPIELIKVGDVVATSKGFMPVKWVARRTISKPLVGDDFYISALPMVIRANSLEDGVPNKDLYVSESHGIYADGKIVNASFLGNGLTISKASPDDFKASIQYLHLEFEEEVLVEANGALACSFVNRNNRRYFDNYPEFISRYFSTDLTASSVIRSGPRNRPSLQGHKDRVKRAWMSSGCTSDSHAHNQAATAQLVTF
ncbi:MAG: Hint domain-containing protein [Cyanobacteriota bacterium]|nr:Hint domain-containing protein [Cyanobacteriota bacterium]